MDVQRGNFHGAKEAFLNVLVFLLLLEMTHCGYILNICKVVLGPCNFPDSQQLVFYKSFAWEDTVPCKNFIPAEGVCMCACVKVYRYLLRSNVVRNPHKAYRSLAQGTTVADNRNHYDLHQFDKRQEETLMATE